MKKRKRVQKGQAVISFRSTQAKKQYLKDQGLDIKQVFNNFLDDLMNQSPKPNIIDMSDIFD